MVAAYKAYGVKAARIAAAFRAALLLQGLIALAIIGAVVVAWLTLWGRRPAGAESKEPPGRRLLRIGFGLLWLFDGILQAQPGMPAGPGAASDRAHRVELAALGAARGELGRHRLDPSPGAEINRA